MELRAEVAQKLVDEGLISSVQLKQAHDDRKEHGGLLGDAIISLGFLSDQALTAFLSRHYGIPAIDHVTRDIRPEVIKLIRAEVARRLVLIPVARTGEFLTVALADPSYPFTKDDLENYTRLKVELVLATETSILAAIGRYYDPGREMPDQPDELERVCLPRLECYREEVLQQVAGLTGNRLLGSLQLASVNNFLLQWEEYFPRLQPQAAYLQSCRLPRMSRRLNEIQRDVCQARATYLEMYQAALAHEQQPATLARQAQFQYAMQQRLDTRSWADFFRKSSPERVSAGPTPEVEPPPPPPPTSPAAPAPVSAPATAEAPPPPPAPAAEPAPSPAPAVPPAGISVYPKPIELKKARFVNTWFEGEEPVLPLRLGDWHIFKLNIGARRQDFSGTSAPFTEPAFGQQNQQNLLVSFFSEHFEITKRHIDLVLPRAGDTDAIETRLKPIHAGECVLEIVVSLAKELEILQTLEVRVEAIEAAVAAALGN